MPRKDSITGCPVMTTEEFLRKEAERENKTVEEVYDDTFGAMHRAMDEDANSQAQDYKNDPGRYLRENWYVDTQYPDWIDCVDRPRLILFSWGCRAYCKYRESGGSFWALGLNKLFLPTVYSYSDFIHSGSFYEPPDGETIVYSYGVLRFLYNIPYYWRRFKYKESKIWKRLVNQH